MEIRKEIMDFALVMERVMRTHDENKGDSWKVCDIQFLETKLGEEFIEWKDSGYDDFAKREIVDIANICMMLFHRYDVEGEMI